MDGYRQTPKSAGLADACWRHQHQISGSWASLTVGCDEWSICIDQVEQVEENQFFSVIGMQPDDVGGASSNLRHREPIPKRAASTGLPDAGAAAG